MSSVFVAASPAALADEVAQRIERAARTAIDARGRFALALPGGSVATTCFPRLAASVLDWARTDVFFVDERAVPFDHAESNAGLAHRLLLSHGTARRARVHRMRPDRLSLGEAAADYERRLIETLGDPPTLDLVVLGVGEDGHVASVFPGWPVAAARGGWVGSLDHAPKPPPERVTLTLDTCRLARDVLIVALGEPKARAVRAAREDAASSLPAALVSRGRAGVAWLVDESLAHALQQSQA